MIEAGINKFVAVITDNANNMKAAWRILKEKYPNKIFLGCWTHGINLWVKDIIKHNWANKILNMAKKLSLYFRNHQIPLAALRRIQKDKYRKEIGLNLPVETRWLSAYQCLDSIFKSKMTMMALLGKDITLDREIKIKILDLEQDDPYLSTAFINLRKIEIQIKNNTKISNDFIFVAYRLDLRYNGELLNNQRWDDIIEEELIRLVGKENQNLVLEEYSEFIRKCGVLLTIKELVKNGVTIENSEEKETEDNIEILDDFEELNEMYLEQDLSKEIEEE
ncbi:zinc finger BED domain-containing protein 4-like [Rhizophagus irregularis DAOM 181602=DAOM 197198]|nr:zinc finger BED domain-containing protein 4-like [Rhizophagus irregularis DAOM 181602=DAOM 197198]